MKIELTKIEKIKNHLLLRFVGVCGIGSSGNSDVDFIIEKAKEKVIKDNSIQSIIFDFRNLEYTFGNRFSKLFNPNSYKNNKHIYIRFIPRLEDVENWNSLIRVCTDISNIKVLQVDVKSSIKSINHQMNEK